MLPLIRTLLTVLLLLAAWPVCARAQNAGVPTEAYAYPSEPTPPDAISISPPAKRRSFVGPRGYLGFSALTGMPFEGARGDGGSWAWGFGFAVAGSYADWPVTLGADFAFSYFGTLRGKLRSEHDGERVETIVRRRDKVLFFDLFLRLQPATWVVRPYLEGVVGFKMVNGEYTVGELPADQDNTTAGATRVVHTLGVGAGVELTLSDSEGARVYLSAGARWLHGGEVAYLKTVARGDETSSSSAKFSTTTALFTMGLAVEADLVSVD